MSYQIFLFHKRVFCDQNQQLDVLILVFLTRLKDERMTRSVQIIDVTSESQPAVNLPFWCEPSHRHTPGWLELAAFPLGQADNLCMECATSHLRDKLLVIVLSNLHRLISEVGVSEAKFDRLITGDVW